MDAFLDAFDESEIFTLVQLFLKVRKKQEKDPKALTFRSSKLVENSRLELLTSRV